MSIFTFIKLGYYKYPSSGGSFPFLLSFTLFLCNCILFTASSLQKIEYVFFSDLMQLKKYNFSFVFVEIKKCCNSMPRTHSLFILLLYIPLSMNDTQKFIESKFHAHFISDELMLEINSWIITYFCFILEKAFITSCRYCKFLFTKEDG